MSEPSRAYLTSQIRGAWRELEDFGFPPEAAGWPFVEPDLPGAIEAALRCLVDQREDLLREVVALRPSVEATR